jgi:protein-tyrosine phosphatase
MSCDRVVVTEDDVALYLAHLESKSGANCVLDAEPDAGRPGQVFLGGREASLNPFVSTNSIKRVCNASDLHLVNRSDFRTWAEKVESLEKSGALTHVLRLCWRDEEDQKLWQTEEWDTLVEAIRFVHDARVAGDNCVVHCAQGKSRSGTVVVAYVMALHGQGYEDALSAVKKKRNIVQPNDSFAAQLRKFERSSALAALREEWGAPSA